MGPIQHNEPGIEVAKLPRGRITISILRPQAQLFRSVPDTLAGALWEMCLASPAQRGSTGSQSLRVFRTRERW